ncbi:nucleoside/nucleotide kinase family protein [Actinokineospora pegani]|uniref:nucleoside/nucleotide kinase family protein n=1 Tax=Actinokineospora pegani TaxID=2654637 RepID=UPI001F0092B5|nr:nucleoside/nucleotide kinase family protein [Actinokineospora pegani]
MTREPTFAELVARAAVLAAGPRRVLGITGAPGSGKSTLAARLVEALGDRAALVGMDGFHLAHTVLARLGRVERKGAPDTFDADGYADLLRRLRTSTDRTVYAPEFRREVEDPIACAVPVPCEVSLVVTEGNYLLLWPQIRPLLDEVWFLDLDQDERRERLYQRHLAFGRTPDQARGRTDGSDETNAGLVADTARKADLVLRKIQ